MEMVKRKALVWDVDVAGWVALRAPVRAGRGHH